jgi:hypothetical protein
MPFRINTGGRRSETRSIGKYPIRAEWTITPTGIAIQWRQTGVVRRRETGAIE